MSYLKNLAGRFSLSSLVSGARRFSSTTIEEILEVEKNEVTPAAHEKPIDPILHRDLRLLPKFTKPREVWVENFDEVKEEKRGLIKLHPDIFGTIPRLDLIYDNIRWQRMYKLVNYHQAPSVAEAPGSSRKPWPQKGMGRARHGSRKSPQWKNGGTAHGPRNPTSYFYHLAFSVRVHGLTSTLSAKFAQDDLKVIDKIDVPTEDSNFVTDLIKERHWGLSVLIVDVNDFMSRNLTIALENVPNVNYMPVYGLNVYSMLKHDTLVLTVDAVNDIEDKLLKYIHRNDLHRLNLKSTSFKSSY